MATPRKKEQLTVERIIKAIDGTGGIISRIAERLEVSRQTIYEYLDRYPELKDIIKDEKERTDDILEDTLLDEAVGGWKRNPFDEKEVIYKDPNTAVLIFMGKTRLRHRGYAEKITIDINPQAAALLPELQAALTANDMDLVAVIRDLIAMANAEAESKGKK